MKAASLLKLICGLFCLLSFSVATAADRWESPETVDGSETIGLQQAKQMHAQGAIFIDVRSPRQYGNRHITGALNLFLNGSFSEDNLLKVAKKDTPLVLYCNGINCSLSYKAAERAVGWGFSNIKYFREGIRAWSRDGNAMDFVE
ncbi:MAG: rhodanese-like domain-containing protein [Gammaproteobacteria bacterium]|nr:rhodanese-like domain-containing protein [Gammaproteobacteria bacterium]MBL7000604.1 rhodanese-like domain-containing protein [Gammaproteobacteria bacterium]